MKSIEEYKQECINKLNEYMSDNNNDISAHINDLVQTAINNINSGNSYHEVRHIMTNFKRELIAYYKEKANQYYKLNSIPAQYQIYTPSDEYPLSFFNTLNAIKGIYESCIEEHLRTNLLGELIKYSTNEYYTDALPGINGILNSYIENGKLNHQYAISHQYLKDFNTDVSNFLAKYTLYRENLKLCHDVHEEIKDLKVIDFKNRYLKLRKLVNSPDFDSCYDSLMRDITDYKDDSIYQRIYNVLCSRYNKKINELIEINNLESVANLSSIFNMTVSILDLGLKGVIAYDSILNLQEITFEDAEKDSETIHFILNVRNETKSINQDAVTIRLGTFGNSIGLREYNLDCTTNEYSINFFGNSKRNETNKVIPIYEFLSQGRVIGKSKNNIDYLVKYNGLVLIFDNYNCEYKVIPAHQALYSKEDITIPVDLDLVVSDLTGMVEDNTNYIKRDTNKVMK